MSIIDLCERGLVPDGLTRLGMRRLMAQRLREGYGDNSETRNRKYRKLLDELRNSPIAIATDEANEQHYEVPAEFYRLSLGHRLKYSSCYFADGTADLDAAEDAMLGLYCERAQIRDGMRILDLGCGWGSLTFWLAEHYPHASITSLSNSSSQRAFIEAQAAQRGLTNISVITANINTFDTELRFERVMSVEMFEHMRNYQKLLGNIARWLEPDGKLFVHIFCHRELAYYFETEGDDNWMGRHFFTGGIMPSENLLLNFQSDLVLDEEWWVSGTHYQKTSEAWLARLDANAAAVTELFRRDYSPREAAIWVQRWRIFFMACAELFGYRNGEQWGVAHYLFSRRQVQTAPSN